MPVAIFACALALCARAGDWPRFRGPNGSGVAETTGLPEKFGPDRDVIWKTALPLGHSSPVLSGDRIFLTAADHDKLFTFCLNRETGQILWRRECPRNRAERLDQRNTAASPTAATDGKNVYVLFGDFGLVSYGFDGNERWRLLWWLFLQRFCYRQVMYYVMVKSVTTALHGAVVGWGKLERKATVEAQP